MLIDNVDWHGNHNADASCYILTQKRNRFKITIFLAQGGPRPTDSTPGFAHGKDIDLWLTEELKCKNNCLYSKYKKYNLHYSGHRGSYTFSSNCNCCATM